MPMGRVTSFWFSNDLLQRIDAAAAAAKLTRSAWVKRAITKALPKT